MKAKDMRKGNVLLYQNTPYQVMEFYHHTPGNLRAVVQAKLRNLINGTQTDVRFSSTEDLETANLESFNATYLYQQGPEYHFMRTETFETFFLTAETLGNKVNFLQENLEVEIKTFNESPIQINLPQTVTLTIVECEPEMKGGTASASYKTATTDTGLAIQVPPFVKIGDKITVGTEEGNYLSRV